MSVIISDYSYRSNLSSEAWQDLLDGRINQRYLHCNHRYSEWSQACLGEIEFSRYNIHSSLLLKSDRLMVELLTGMIDELNLRNQIFSRYKPHEISFIFGTTTVNLENFKTVIKNARNSQNKVFDILDHKIQMGWFFEEIKNKFPIRGLTLNTTNSCSSGAISIIKACQLVASGASKVCIAGGVDLLNLVTVKGFEALQILNTSPSLPLSGQSSGINLSDGGALVVVENSEHSKKIRATILGHGSTSDAFHMTQPFPQGKYMQKAMEKAIYSSGVSLEEICYINAHGTGTEANDTAELHAVNQVFLNTDKLESTKIWTGHTLAGAGALEFVLSCEKLVHRDRKLDTRFLSNSFGFGGTNVSLIAEVRRISH